MDTKKVLKNIMGDRVSKNKEDDRGSKEYCRWCKKEQPTIYESMPSVTGRSYFRKICSVCNAVI